MTDPVGRQVSAQNVGIGGVKIRRITGEVPLVVKKHKTSDILASRCFTSKIFSQKSLTTVIRGE